jgi:hypothetical protein
MLPVVVTKVRFLRLESSLSFLVSTMVGRLLSSDNPIIVVISYPMYSNALYGPVSAHKIA